MPLLNQSNLHTMYNITNVLPLHTRFALSRPIYARFVPPVGHYFHENNTTQLYALYDLRFWSCSHIS